MPVRRKKRYQTKGNIYPPLVMTGRCTLLHHDETYGESLQAGDVQFYMHSDTTHREKDDPQYEYIGGSGYLKADIYDGRDWQFLIMDDLFSNREHHFSKKERPLDTYAICADIIAENNGTVLHRTYRRHYTLAPEKLSEEEQDGESSES